MLFRLPILGGGDFVSSGCRSWLMMQVRPTTGRTLPRPNPSGSERESSDIYRGFFKPQLKLQLQGSVETAPLPTPPTSYLN